MLNILWSVLILTGILWGAAAGKLDHVTQGLLDSAKDTVALGLTLFGVMSFWCGIMKIGERAGLIDWLSGKMNPLLDVLFPELSREHPARRPIAVNLVANMLGLGMAATPAGLEAMKAMVGEEERRAGVRAATNSMCTFLIINISSLQLIPVSMIAYRSQYGSASPAAVTGSALIATACSTLVAVLFCKFMDLRMRLAASRRSANMTSNTDAGRGPDQW